MVGTRTTSWKVHVLSVLAGVLAALLVVLTGAGTRLSFALYDAAMRRLAAATSVKAEAGRIAQGLDDPASLVLVEIDQQSLEWVQHELALGWPWPRELYGVMARFFRFARVQTFDILFSETSVYGPDDDARCAAAMEEAGNVVVARTLAAPSRIAAPHIASGHVQAVLDQDGMARRYMLWIARDGERLPSLGLASLQKAGWTIPESLASKQHVRLRFDEDVRFRKLSAAEVLHAAMHPATSSLTPEGFRNAIVVAGLTAPGLLDRQAVPVSAAYPGMRIHATFIGNAMRGTFIEEAPWPARGLVVIMLAVAGAALAMALALGLEQSVRRHALARQRQVSQGAQAAATVGSGANSQGDAALAHAELHRGRAQTPATAPLLAAGMAISIVAAAAATSELLFRNGIFLDIVPGAFAALVSFLVMIVLSVRREQARKAFLEKAFGLYLAPEVISEMAASDQALELGGTRRVITVLFSDLQGFTSIAETLPPERLTAFMNRYLGLISEEILARRGTLDKYVGDAVMAFWNAPLAEPRHPLLAILAAAAIQERLAREAQSFLQEFGVQPVTRIGIATGEAVVGNLGSRSRFAYTAIGDCVNVASRLEAANKLLGTQVLVADATVEHAGAAPDGQLTIDDGSRQWTLRALGLGLLEGKQIPVRVWSFHGEEWSGGYTPWEGVTSLSK